MKITGRIAVGVMALGLSGCVSHKLATRLREHAVTETRNFDEILHQLQTRKPRKIGWKEALKRMRRDNLSMQRSTHLLAQTEEQRKKQWLGLLPGVSAFVNISKQITALTQVNSNDLNASLVASFNIPNPFQFYGRLYATALEIQSAKWSHEMDERRAYTELYSAFLQSRDLQKQRKELRFKKSMLSSAIATVDVDAIHNIDSMGKSLRRSELSQRVNVNRLLNTPGANWILSGPLPKISYRKKYRDIKIGKHFGQMALNLYTVRIESAILQVERVKFQRWPSLQFGLSQPPLYSKSAGNSLTADEFRLFSGASRPFDLSDPLDREDVQNAKVRLAETRKQLKLSMEQEGVRLMQIRNSYSDLLGKEALLKARLKNISTSTHEDVDMMIHDLELRSDIQEELITVQRQLSQLDLQYLIWDETYWKS